MSNLPADHGPYETAQQAADTISEAYGLSYGLPTGTMGQVSRDRIIAACDAAGVELGAYDRRIVNWLAGWEPETCAAIAGLILRASKANEQQQEGQG